MRRWRCAPSSLRCGAGEMPCAVTGSPQGEADSHWSWASVRGSRGPAESGRGPGERGWSVRVRTEGWASDNGEIGDEERTPSALFLAGDEVERRAEGTALMLTAFRATIQRCATAGSGTSGRRGITRRRHGRAVVGERITARPGSEHRLMIRISLSRPRTPKQAEPIMITRYWSPACRGGRQVSATRNPAI
jgi:hypothetical protein